MCGYGGCFTWLGLRVVRYHWHHGKPRNGVPVCRWGKQSDTNSRIREAPLVVGVPSVDDNNIVAVG